AHEIGLSLRCVVARTLGIVVAATKDLYLVEPKYDYNIKLGSGLPVEGFSIMSENRIVGPIQTTSLEINSKWLVQLKPFHININTYEQLFENLMFIFEKLKPTFDKMINLRIRF
ncbi:MAG: hypothetical protein KDC80_20515, partial [Saprospiraceae bacterium]|nr:hypothetical protein [Saprospiraceae bacterium]